MTSIINPPGLKRQSYYNHAVIRTGTPVFLTGQVAWDADGRIVGFDDYEAQAAQIWRNIACLLTEIQARPEHIVKLVTYAVSRDALPALHAERGRFFTDGNYPASTFILVAGLAEPELLAEIDVTLMLPA